MSIIPTSASASFPGCALSCTQLLQAEQYCEPPNIAQAAQLTYDQCFCRSAFLTPLLSTTDTVCVTECAILSDRQLLRAWYNNFCAQVANGVDPTTLTTTASAATATIVTATSTATSGTVTVTPTSSSSATAAASARQGPWIDTHWKWILMVAILAIGLALLAWLAVWLKRRHKRKLEKARAAASGFGYDPEKRPANDPRRSATPDLWGPHQMMAVTNGFGYGADEIVQESVDNRKGSYRGATSSKKSGHDIVEISDIDKALNMRPSNKRARPSELEVQARMIGAADRRSKSRGQSRPHSTRQNTKETQVEHEQKSEKT